MRMSTPILPSKYKYLCVRYSHVYFPSEIALPDRNTTASVHLHPPRIRNILTSNEPCYP
jgi:hypothetical protein